METKYSSLLAHLYDSGVLERREREDIEAELTSTRQNQKLLSVLSRKSVEQFQQFLAALDNTDQQHITDRLSGTPRLGNSLIQVNLGKHI